MSMKFPTIAAAALSACSMVPADSPGKVVAFNGSSVTIEGGFNMYGDPAPAPIQAHANKICEGTALFQGQSGARPGPVGYGPAVSLGNLANAGYVNFFFICEAAK